MGTFSLNFIPNASLVVLLGQASIPIAMIISKIVLNAKYEYYQYSGAGIVLLGIVCVLIPQFMAKAPAAAAHTDPPLDNYNFDDIGAGGERFLGDSPTEGT